jgi:hypothetical protein
MKQPYADRGGRTGRAGRLPGSVAACPARRRRCGAKSATWGLAISMLSFACGCFRITIDPQCPDEIEVGQTGALIAHQATPGAIARYFWEADPPDRTAIADSAEPDTSFEALLAGPVTFTLTATDGLFQMIDTCTTTIVAPGEGEPEPEPEPELSVNLVANPTMIDLGGGEASSLLTCTNTGDVPATLTIDQLDGPPANLTPALPGIVVAEFPQTAGEYVFRCLATDAAGQRSDPAVVTVTLQGSSRPGPR